MVAICIICTVVQTFNLEIYIPLNVSHNNRNVKITPFLISEKWKIAVAKVFFAYPHLLNVTYYIQDTKQVDKKRFQSS